MVEFRVKEQLKKKNISRYRLQKLTNWNYKRINAFYKNKALESRIEEIDKLCEIFNCGIEELIEIQK